MEALQNAFEKALVQHLESQNLDEAELRRSVEKVPQIVPRIIDDISDSTLNTLREDAPAMLKERRAYNARFEKRIQKRWKPALDLLEMFLVIAYEAGAEFNDTFREEASRQSDKVFVALTMLHARGCQIGFEILALIKSGFADAAHARWRTLHEIAVVAFVIAKHGQDIAERYLLHEVIASYKAMCQYQKSCLALNVEPYTEDDVKSSRQIYDDLVNRFGSSFKGDYGWAAGALRKATVSFSDLEEEAGLGHLRPYYKMASHNVHANIKGAKFRLGLGLEKEPLLLAGPSNYGFADPANGAAISLSQVTVALLNTRPNLDRLVVLTILNRLTKEIGEEFLRIQTKLEEEASSQRGTSASSN